MKKKYDYHKKIKELDRVEKKAYGVWVGIFNRCYLKTDPKYRHYGAEGVVVSHEWHSFTSFVNWFTQHYKEGYQLDKDILSEGSKTYSPKTCCMIPSSLNQAIAINTKKKIDLPHGVFKTSDGYVARCIFQGKLVLDKTFSTPEEAGREYILTKQTCVRLLVRDLYEEGKVSYRVYEKLQNWEFPYPTTIYATKQV